MANTKAKMVVIGAAAMLLVGGSGAGISYYILRSSRSPGDRTASGIAKPEVTVESTKVETPKFTWVEPPVAPRVVKPYHGPHVIGYARTVDGTPVSGAEAILSYVDRPASMPWGMGKALVAPMTAKTSADGRFEFAPAEEPAAVVVRNEKGMGSARISAQSPSLSVILEPWGRVEGVFRTGDKPLVKQPLAVKLEDQGPWFPDRGFLIPRTRVTTDEAGRFVIDRVPPGRRVQIGNVGTARMLSHYHGFDVAAGTTTRVVAGGGGRVIVGHLEAALPQCDARLVTLKIKTDDPIVTEEQRSARAERARKIEEKMRKTPELQNYQDRDYLENSYIAFVNPAGQFRM